MEPLDRSSDSRERFQCFSRAAAGVGAGFGALVLSGWALGLRALQAPLPWLAATKPNTALCLLLLGGALYLTMRPQVTLRRRRAALACGAAAALLTVASLAQDLLGVELGIDQLVFHDDASVAHPGRMAASSALCLLLIAAAQVIIASERDAAKLVPWVVLPALFGSFVALLGYALGVGVLYEARRFTPMSATSAIAILALASGTLLARPGRWLLDAASDSPSATAARRLFPALVSLQIAFGFLRLAAQRAGWFGTELGIAILTSANVLAVITVGALTTARSVALEAARVALLGKLSDRRIEALTEALDDAFVATDQRGVVVGWNASAERLFGYRRDEILGSPGTRLAAVDGEAERGRVWFDASNLGREERTGRRRDGSTFPCELSTSRWISDEGNEHQLVIVRDISAPKELQIALAAERERYRNLVNGAPIPIFETNADGDCTFVNDCWLELSGIPYAEALGKGWAAAIHPDDRERVFVEWYAAAAEARRFVLDYRFVSRAGAESWVSGSATALRSASGATTGYVGTLLDVTDRRRATELLERSERTFRELLQRAPFAVIVHRRGVAVYANEAFARLLGFAHGSDLIGVDLLGSLVHPDARAAAVAAMAATSDAMTPGPAVRCVRRDGVEVLLEAMSAEVTFDGAAARVAVATDVTERLATETARVAAENVVRASLAEKEVLLKEIHHRVKNNLQVIASIVNLHAARIAEPTVRVVFDEVRSRIHAIALLHERLYRSTNLGRIEMHEYLEGLVADIARASGNPHVTIAAFAEISVGMDLAVPLGLIVNELVSNAYKHAFPDGRRGSITVRIDEVGSQLTLAVADDGVGIPQERELATARSLGMVLVRSLSEQLGGTLDFQRDGGTRCVVRFSKGGSGDA